MVSSFPITHRHFLVPKVVQNCAQKDPNFHVLCTATQKKLTLNLALLLTQFFKSLYTGKFMRTIMKDDITHLSIKFFFRFSLPIFLKLITFCHTGVLWKSSEVRTFNIFRGSEVRTFKIFRGSEVRTYKTFRGSHDIE
jgi:hypothetical protein